MRKFDSTTMSKLWSLSNKRKKHKLSQASKYKCCCFPFIFKWIVRKTKCWIELVYGSLSHIKWDNCMNLLFFYLKEFVIKTASRTSNAKFIGLISIDEWMKNAADNPNKMKANLNYFEWIFMLKPFQANAKWSICQFHLHESTQLVFFYCSCVPFLDSQPRTRKFNVAAFSEICYYNNFATQNSFIIKITMALYAYKFISFSKKKRNISIITSCLLLSIIKRPTQSVNYYWPLICRNFLEICLNDYSSFDHDKQDDRTYTIIYYLLMCFLFRL